MLNKGIRLGLTVLFFGLSVWQFAQVNIGNGIMWLLFSGLVLLTYFRNEKNIADLLVSEKKQNRTRQKNPQQHLKSGTIAYKRQPCIFLFPQRDFGITNRHWQSRNFHAQSLKHRPANESRQSHGKVELGRNCHCKTKKTRSHHPHYRGQKTGQKRPDE